MAQARQANVAFLSKIEGEKRYPKPRATVYLAGAVISPSDEDSQTFSISFASGEIYRLRAVNAKERQYWVSVLRNTAEEHTQAICQNVSLLSSKNSQHSTFKTMYPSLSVLNAFNAVQEILLQLRSHQQNLSATIEQLPSSVIQDEDEVTDEEESCYVQTSETEEQTSVNLHLLSHMKLGMDLTQVVLPTYILENRSLLEMFADALRHPEYFLQIGTAVDSGSRMIAVLEWFLTSFHAAHVGQAAKKPYNPVLGETFHCSFRVSSGNSNPRYIRYVGEQISHHPPSVNLVGEVTIHALKANETYVIALPSLYARSVLSCPWIELGDRSTITCAQSGYNASVTFHTKGDSKVIEVHKLVRSRKRVRPLKQQSEYESRKLWFNVSSALQENDVNTATEHKKFIEDRQRAEEKTRQVGEQFTPRYFHQEGDNWLYNSLKKSKDGQIP